MKKYLGLVLSLAAVILLSFALYRASFHARKFSSRPYNLIVISLDTLRADRLSAYGYARATSPAIDAFAANSVLFEKAIAVSSWTLPAHASLFTGVYPSSHGAITSSSRISGEIPMLAEILRERGYSTFGFTGGGYLAGRFGFKRGFEKYLITEKNRKKGLPGLANSLETARQVIQSLAEDKPYFVFVHTFDVHCPYTPSDRYAAMFNNAGAVEVTGECRSWKRQQTQPISAPEAAALSDLYDGSIREVDDALAPFFSFLRDSGQLKKTVVVITSDHGEDFLQHGTVGHETGLFKELLHVPLIVAAPGLKAGRVRELAGQIDIMPTIIELLGLPLLPHFQGRSLAGVVQEEQGERVRYSELARHQNLRSRFGQTTHLIVDVEKEALLFFDHMADPDEQRNLGEGAAAVGRAKNELQKFFEALPKRLGEEAGGAKEEELERLRSLGYL